MTRYRMSDDMIVETDKASASWNEARYWDGSDHISLATGSTMDHQTLYRSRRGRYYIEQESLWAETRPSAAFVSMTEACRWLLNNEHDPSDHDWPEDLTNLVERLTE